MYSTFNEVETVITERFIRILENKIYKHMTTVSKNVYFDVLDDIVDKYNNTYHKTMKLKSIDVISDFYDECNVYSNEKDPKFQVGNHTRVSKYKKNFVKGCTPNWSEEVFVISKITHSGFM